MTAAKLTQRWMELDRASATSRIDRDAIEATTAAREALVALLLIDPKARDVLHASAMLGRLLASLGASAALAAATSDALGSLLETPIAPVRASLIEAYVAEREERAFGRGLERWAYPGCCVHLAEGECAIAAGLPDDDDDSLTNWADSVARSLARAKVRRAKISGSERARRALEDALALVGIRAEREFVVR